jgi:hypothetical protein
MGLAGNRRPYLADAADIEQWANSIMARSDLARLLRSVIVQTNDQARVRHMPAGDASELPGYDGIVEAAKGTSFVPEGRSVWEFGTSGDPGKKANHDYNERTSRPLGETQGGVTFVFVTPRRWPGKKDWMASKEAESPWKSILALDVEDIEMALEQAPGAHMAFSFQMGKLIHEVRGIDEWWHGFSTRSNPPLNPEMVLAGRADDSASLLQRLGQDITRTTISAVSIRELLAFVAATILRAGEEQGLSLLGRTLVVHDRQALRMLDTSSNLLILVPFDEQLQREAQFVQNHHVLLWVPEGMPADLALSRIDPNAFAEVLKVAGIEDGRRREDLSRLAARSIVAYQNRSPASGALPNAGWLRWLQDQPVRRAWLAGGWSSARSGDLEVITAVLANPYDDVVSRLEEAAGGEDPIFTAVGATWGVVSPEASWDYVQRSMTSADLRAVETAIQTVLGAIDPALSLPTEERWKASVYGKSRIHSSTLRKGLAATLALLGALGEEKQLGGGLTARSWAEGAVWQLLTRANEDSSSELWSSLGDVLSQLAEAAPAEFLSAVERGTTGSDPVLAKLFTDQGDHTFGINSPHTGLLWALELLAWSPEHLGRAAELLAQLAELDPGGKLSNRPDGSLVDIFRPWYPQSGAGPEARLRVLEAIAGRHPDLGARLLFALLPERHGFSMPNQAPLFREWKPKDDRVLVREVNQVTESVIEQLLRLVEKEPRHWPTLIEHLPELMPEPRMQIYAILEDLSTHE